MSHFAVTKFLIRIAFLLTKILFCAKKNGTRGFYSLVAHENVFGGGDRKLNQNKIRQNSEGSAI
ncbi:MAG TPA: hypothetical protein DHU79_07635 [Clostridiales bacterium]|nr:hypothetical protein [Clostridiales bacterium]